MGKNYQEMAIEYCQTLLNEKGIEIDFPEIVIKPTMRTYANCNKNLIVISKIHFADWRIAKKVLRHELAHIVLYQLNGNSHKEYRHHGKEFYDIVHTLGSTEGQGEKYRTYTKCYRKFNGNKVTSAIRDYKRSKKN